MTRNLNSRQFDAAENRRRFRADIAALPDDGSLPCVCGADAVGGKDVPCVCGAV